MRVNPVQNAIQKFDNAAKRVRAIFQLDACQYHFVRNF